jgi:hypothetical protein
VLLYTILGLMHDAFEARRVSDRVIPYSPVFSEANCLVISAFSLLYKSAVLRSILGLQLRHSGEYFMVESGRILYLKSFHIHLNITPHTT